jgi:hypothetical protein
MVCSVTAIARDRRRSTLEVEACSVNSRHLEYNYRAVGNSQGLVVPDRQTLFEVEENGTLHRTSWDRVKALLYFTIPDLAIASQLDERCDFLRAR